MNPRRDPGRAILRQAIEGHEIPPNTNIEVALDLMYGALFHRLFQAHAHCVTAS